jgi:predicted acyl esterase
LFSDTPKSAVAAELSVDFSDRSDADFQVPDSGFDTRNALVFETVPLDRPTEIEGLFHGHIEVVTNKRDFDLAVNFFEQLADGSYFPLASYLGRASFMQDRSHRHLLTPGKPQRLDFDSQMLTARLIAAGSRIVAVIAVPKQPDIQMNYGTGGDVSDESIADAKEPLHLAFRPGSYLEIGCRCISENPFREFHNSTIPTGRALRR